MLVVMLGMGVLWLPIDLAAITVTVGCSSGGDISPKGVLGVPANSEMDVRATPNRGYEVRDWYVDGAPAGWTVNQQHFAFGDLDVSIYVAFSRVTNSVHTSADSHGRIDPNDSNSPLLVGWGDSVVFTATPDAHYHVAAWTLDVGSGNRVVQSGGLAYTLQNVTNESWLAVGFAPDTYTLQASANGRGSLTPTGTVAVIYGDNQSFTATPAVGHDVVVWSLDGQSVLTNQPAFTVFNVQANHTVQVSFSAPVLALVLTPTNTCVVSWPDAMSSYTLQESAELKTTGWTNSIAVPTDRSGRQETVLPRSNARRFYRLTGP